MWKIEVSTAQNEEISKIASHLADTDSFKQDAWRKRKMEDGMTLIIKWCGIWGLDAGWTIALGWSLHDVSF